jgi:hypothetical protein
LDDQTVQLLYGDVTELNRAIAWQFAERLQKRRQVVNVAQPNEAESSKLNRRQLIIGAMGFTALAACGKDDNAAESPIAAGEGEAEVVTSEIADSTQANSAATDSGVDSSTDSSADTNADTKADSAKDTNADAPTDTGADPGAETVAATDGANAETPSATNSAIAIGRAHNGPFFGLEVADFPRTDPGPGVATRLHIEWDAKEEFGTLVSQLAAHPNAAKVEALVIGSFFNEVLDSPGPAIDALIANAAAFASMKALYFGDVSTEHSEISWVECGNQAALANAFPNLELLHIRGAGNGVMTGLSLPKLRSLTIETGGLRPTVVRDVLAAPLPALEHLELWLGTPEYGGETTIGDLEPLLSGSVHPQLKYVGLRNSEMADEIAIAIAQSPRMATVVELDLSLGTLSDQGFEALANMLPSQNLKRLNVAYHYGSRSAIETLTTAMRQRNVQLDATDPQTAEPDNDRYVSISE